MKAGGFGEALRRHTQQNAATHRQNIDEPVVPAEPDASASLNLIKSARTSARDLHAKSSPDQVDAKGEASSDFAVGLRDRIEHHSAPAPVKDIDEFKTTW